MKLKITLILITVFILLAGILGSVCVLHQETDGKIAQIYQNDTMLYEIDLDSVEESYTITIDGEDGESNVILVEHGAISMESASCPDKLCVKQGKLSGGKVPIVCLPNHVRISLVQEGSGVDVESY